MELSSMAIQITLSCGAQMVLQPHRVETSLSPLQKKTTSTMTQPIYHRYESLVMHKFVLYKLGKIVSNPKQPAVKKGCGPQECCCEKRCEIQSGGQEMAVIVG